MFKATAGLHHPIRHGTTHGFLNLLAAAALAHAAGLGETELEAVLAEEDPAAFEVSADALTVHGHTRRGDEIAAARAALFTGYGSCSFSEPVDDLRALGLL